MQNYINYGHFYVQAYCTPIQFNRLKFSCNYMYHMLSHLKTMHFPRHLSVCK
jgi:hypothetical protein